MKLSYIINELFETEAPIEWDIQRGHWRGTFFIGDQEYHIQMQKHPADFEDSQVPWEIAFQLVRRTKHVTPSGSYRDTRVQRTHSITGTGNATKVFAVVMSAIKVWMDAENPETFIIVADEPSRQKLYARLMRLLPKEWVWTQSDQYFFAAKSEEDVVELEEEYKNAQNKGDDY